MSLPASLNFDMLERQGQTPASPFAGMSRRERRVSLVSRLGRYQPSSLSGQNRRKSSM